MYIVARHEIRDPVSFWQAVQAGMTSMPPQLTLHQAFPNENGTQAVCLWEADEMNEVRDFVEESVGAFSRNHYFMVDAGNALGLPGEQG
jgi:hypothetical protein